MPNVSKSIKQDPNWTRALILSRQLNVNKYPATWVLKFINEWNAAVTRLRR